MAMQTSETRRTVERLTELARRESAGLEVALLWNPDDDTVRLVVVDTRGDQSFVLKVARETALDAFHHPFAYAGSSG
jgi:hypothetical protein